MASTPSFVRVFGLALFSVIGVGLIGCSESDHDHDRDNNHNYDRVSSRTPDTYDIAGLPRGAQVLDSGNGPVSVRAPDRGMAYLVDQDSGRLIWSGRIDRGERLTVDPDNDRASLNGRVIYDRNLERKHRHAIYFSTRDSDRSSY